MSENKSGFERAVEVMARLRAPDGCPWDKEQDHQSLKPYLVEEAYEVMEAIEANDPAMLKEELGDLLLQVLFHCRLAEEKGLFDADGDRPRPRAKDDRPPPPRIRGHPGRNQRRGAQELGDQQEKGARGGRERRGLHFSTACPPPCPRSSAPRDLQGKASRVGFDWPDASGAADKVDEEWAELKAAMRKGDREAIEQEMGDFLFAAVNLSRKLGVNAEGAARACIGRFTSSVFNHIEKTLRARGLSPEDVPLEELEALWNAAKKAGRSGG